MSHPFSKPTFQTIRGAIQHSLKQLWGVGQPKRCEQLLQQAKRHNECCFWGILGLHRDLVITLDKINFLKHCNHASRLKGLASCMFGKGYLSGVVTKLRQL
jgi:hypothetical protein